MIHYAVRPKRRTVPTPIGWKIFLDFLQKNNVPKELLASHHHHRFPPAAAESLSTDDEDEVFLSPKAEPLEGSPPGRYLRHGRKRGLVGNTPQIEPKRKKAQTGSGYKKNPTYLRWSVYR
jgi:hypothetical protein